LQIASPDFLLQKPVDGGLATLQQPKSAIVAKSEKLSSARRLDRLVIRHVSDDEVVAVIEIVSRGNKRSRDELDAFVRKANAYLENQIHFSFVDVYPPGRLDPQGIHGAIWDYRGEESELLPDRKPLVASGYKAGDGVTAYVNPFGLEDTIPETPL